MFRGNRVSIVLVVFTNDDVPILPGLGYFISTPHFGKSESTHNKDDETRDFPGRLLILFQVPMAVSGTKSDPTRNINSD